MESKCECSKFEENFNEMISFFVKSYGKFLKTKAKDLIEKKKIDNTQSDYDILMSLCQSIPPTADECLTRMQKCSKNHSVEIEEITQRKSKIDEIKENINRHFEELKNQIPNYYVEEEDEQININNIKNNNNNNNKDNKDNIINDKSLEEMTDEELLENGRKTIVLIENLLNDKEIKSKNNEEKRQIIQVKNQIKDIINNMEVELYNNDEQIDRIEENVDNGFVLVEKGNINLEDAAKNAIKRRRIEYQMKFAAAFGLAGSVIPGLGKLVGAGIGCLVGYGAYQIDKYRLKEIKNKEEKEEKKKEKEEEKERKRLEKEERKKEKEKEKEEKENGEEKNSSKHGFFKKFSFSGKK